jgi:hypothetical protein
MMVAKPNGEIIALVEIEEGQCSPKKIIGDIFTNLMCNRYAVAIEGEQRYFSITPETVLVIAGIMNPRGVMKNQLEKTIKPRISHFHTPEGGVRLDKVWLIFEDRMEVVIEALKTRFRELLGI